MAAFRLLVDQQLPSASQPQGAIRFVDLFYTAAQSTQFNGANGRSHMILSAGYPSK